MINRSAVTLGFAAVIGVAMVVTAADTNAIASDSAGTVQCSAATVGLKNSCPGDYWYRASYNNFVDCVNDGVAGQAQGLWRAFCCQNFNVGPPWSLYVLWNA